MEWMWLNLKGENWIILCVVDFYFIFKTLYNSNIFFIMFYWRLKKRFRSLLWRQTNLKATMSTYLGITSTNLLKLLFSAFSLHYLPCIVILKRLRISIMRFTNVFFWYFLSQWWSTIHVFVSNIILRPF